MGTQVQDRDDLTLKQNTLPSWLQHHSLKALGNILTRELLRITTLQTLYSDISYQTQALCLKLSWTWLFVSVTCFWIKGMRKACWYPTFGNCTVFCILHISHKLSISFGNISKCCLLQHRADKFWNSCSERTFGILIYLKQRALGCHIQQLLVWKATFTHKYHIVTDNISIFVCAWHMQTSLIIWKCSKSSD